MAKNVKDLYVIDSVFRTRIDYTFGGDDFETLQSVEKRVFAWEDKYNVDINTSSGGPCWNAYFIIEGDNWKNVRKVAEMIIRLILRYKGGKIL